MDRPVIPMRNLCPLLVTLALPVSADVHSGQSWAQGDAGGNFAVVHFDLDDETGALSVNAEYFGLLGSLTQVLVEDEAGDLLLDVPHDGGTEGFMAGTVLLDPTQTMRALMGEGRVVFLTTAFPEGEMEAFNAIDPRVFRSFPLEPDQVSGGGDAGASGTGHLWLDELGNAFLSGQVTGLSDPVTSVELRGPAWYGELGVLLATFDNVAENGALATFDHWWQDPGPPAQVLQDLKDGLAYFVVRTTTRPGGAVRGQAFAGRLGDEYCAPRSNSASTIGAQLHAEGSVRASDNDLVLRAQFLPPGKPVLPIVGSMTGHVFAVPGSDGSLCVGGGGLGRLLANLGTASAGGHFNAAVDLGDLPAHGAVQAGERLNFQLWFRDANPDPTSNFSSAVSIRFR